MTDDLDLATAARELKEFESFLIPSHPAPFDFLLPDPLHDLRDGDPILGEPDAVIATCGLASPELRCRRYVQRCRPS